MLDLTFNRRDFIRLGAAGAGLSLMTLEDSIAANLPKNDKSIIWVWLSGGPSHFETFNAQHLDVPSDEYLPVTGNVRWSGHDIALGGLFERTSYYIPDFNVVANFSHGDSSHGQATHWLQTGHYNPDRSTTAADKYPSHGSVVSAIFGPNQNNGIPTYIKQNGIGSDGPAWLGNAHGGFDPKSKDNLALRIPADRFENRRSLLDGLDRSLQREGDSLDAFKSQAYQTILSEARKAFETDGAWESVKGKYGDSTIGKQLFSAMKLAAAGGKFITVNYGGWDMHSNIKDAMTNRVPPLDHALAGLFKDLRDYGRRKDTMVVITGEFGRTKLNANAGRDHWPSITPLLIYGGDYETGRLIGETDRYNYSPKGNKFGPIDLQATMFDHLNIDPQVQRVDNAGRPRFLLAGDHRVILA